MRTFPRFAGVLLAVVLLGAIAGLGRAAGAQDASPAVSHAAFPVAVENCGRTVTLDAPPERVVAMHPLTAEVLLRLGLGDRIIGVGFAQSYPVAPDLAGAFASLPVLTTDAPPAREALLQARPDLVFDNLPGFNYDPELGRASVEELEAGGAQVFSFSARCVGKEAQGSLDDLLVDVEQIGRIFGVPDRAAALIDEMRGRLGAVEAAVAGRPPVRVMIYDSGQGPMHVYGPGGFADVVARAGGENVFLDQPREFLFLSPEEVALRDPEVFVIPDFGETRMMSMGDDASPEGKTEYLFATFPNATATKDGRVVVVPYQQLFTSLQNVDGVEALARALHPDAFPAATPGAVVPTGAIMPTRGEG